ncbi:MAG: hypothetical protein ACOVN0_07290 [Niveispirillum sp.]|uniref:hypothetical protein n=1 Tax=Niveispirillum sp. TaxID=1917217 RepID=UPI003BA56201
MTGMDHLALWTQGVPLQQAYIRFAPKELAERWQALREESSNLAVLNRLKSAVETDTFQAIAPENRWAAFASVAPTAIGPTGAFHTLTQQLQARCVHLVRSGQLVAVGYAVPRAVTDKLAQVPDDLWLRRVNWDKGIISGSGLRMEDVRIARAQTVATKPAQMMASLKLAAEVVAPGRPSKEPEIIAAFEKLRAAGQIDPSRPRVQHYDLIRKTIDPSYNDKTPGLSTNAMQRILKPYFDALDDDPKLKKP